jgi:modulator of FtsH protease HflC
MQRNYLTLTIGILLVLIFGAMFCSFQVRQNQIALVTTFGKPTRSINVDSDKPEPGLYFKWPWPIQDKLIFDKRIQNFETKFEESPTKDSYMILSSVYAGWTISDPALFRERFGGSVTRAENDLEGLLRSAKSGIISKHPFSDFISPDEKQLKFEDVEKEILGAIQPQAKANYGMDIKFLGIKRIGLPESITQKVFDRMKEERQRFVAKLQADGDKQASDIRSAAERERRQILGAAESEVIRIKGTADLEVAKHLSVFEQNPELALYLLKLQSMEQTLTNRATLILDQRTPPFDLLGGVNSAEKNK